MRPMGSTQHVPPSRPLRFDSYDPEWDLGQSPRHLNLCILLRELLLRAVTPDDTVGMDAFMFFEAPDRKEKCAPDAFVKLGVPNAEQRRRHRWIVASRRSRDPSRAPEDVAPSRANEPGQPR